MMKERIVFYEDYDRALLQTYLETTTARLLLQESTETGASVSEVLSLAIRLHRIARRDPAREVRGMHPVKKTSPGKSGIGSIVGVVAKKMETEAKRREDAAYRKADINDRKRKDNS